MSWIDNIPGPGWFKDPIFVSVEWKLAFVLEAGYRMGRNVGISGFDPNHESRARRAAGSALAAQEIPALFVPDVLDANDERELLSMPKLPLEWIPKATKIAFNFSASTEASDELVSSGATGQANIAPRSGSTPGTALYPDGQPIIGPNDSGIVAIFGEIVLSTATPGGQVWQGGLVLRLETSLQSYVDTDTRQLAAVECMVQGTKGTVEGTARFPFVLPLPRPAAVASHGGSVRSPIPSLVGVSMAVRHGLAVVVRRPWYTFDVSQYFPLQVVVQGDRLLRHWRGLEQAAVEGIVRRRRLAQRRNRRDSIEGGADSAHSDTENVPLSADDVREMPNVVLVDDCGGLVALDVQSCARGTTGPFEATIAVKEQPREQPIVCLRLRVWQEEACDDESRESLRLDEVLFDAWGNKRSLLLPPEDGGADGGVYEDEDGALETDGDVTEEEDDGSAGGGLDGDSDAAVGGRADGIGSAPEGATSASASGEKMGRRRVRKRRFRPLHGSKELSFGFPLDALELLQTVIYRPPSSGDSDSESDDGLADVGGGSADMHRLGRGLVGGPAPSDATADGTIDGNVGAGGSSRGTAVVVPGYDDDDEYSEEEVDEDGVRIASAAGARAPESPPQPASGAGADAPGSPVAGRSLGEGTLSSQTASLVGEGGGPGEGAGQTAGTGPARSSFVPQGTAEDDPDEERREVEAELGAEAQDILGLDPCSFSVRTFVRLDVYTWIVPREERQRLSRWRRQRRRLRAVTKGLEEGDPEAAARLLRQDYKYRAAPPARLRFRRTRMRGDILYESAEGTDGDAYGHGWGTQELLVADAADGLVEDDADGDDDDDDDDGEGEESRGRVAEDTYGGKTGDGTPLGGESAGLAGGIGGLGPVSAGSGRGKEKELGRPGGSSATGLGARSLMAMPRGEAQQVARREAFAATARGDRGGAARRGAQVGHGATRPVSPGGSFTLDTMGSGSVGSSLIMGVTSTESSGIS